ncbi:VOC family protein [Micromonospora zhanjiangensis]|uniref:VOC family protein n=1 Tax=Micromonospora zhanjiangensis TaxID=1522057 RepID=A0ABV8KPV1_9ACTN
MLGKSPARATYSVRDVKQAKEFYGEVLGLDVHEEYNGGLLMMRLAGGPEVMLYGKEDHEPASFTLLTFTVDDIRATVAELVSRGVRFERPDGLELDEQSIHHAPGHYAAWFTDPSGNTLSVTQETSD